MTAHEYAIIGHKRAEIGRWLGFASVLLAPILTSLITWASGWPLLASSIQAKMVAFTVSTGLVYAVLYWVFNRYVWRWLNKVLSIPDLSGTWSVAGKSLSLEGQVKFEWSGTLRITQKWDRIAIELKTSQSCSFSETASVLLKHDGAAKLSHSASIVPIGWVRERLSGGGRTVSGAVGIALAFGLWCAASYGGHIKGPVEHFVAMHITKATIYRQPIGIRLRR